MCYPKDPPDGKLDYALFLPAAPLPADATVCRLVGMSKEDKPHATWKELVVYRDRGMVHVYNLLSHGRRMYRSLVYTSAARFSLRAMKPCHMKDSAKAVPACTRFSAGDWKGYRQEEPSLVVRRLNAALGGREVLLPSRLLYGVLPSALLEAFRFWQGEDMVSHCVHSPRAN